MKSFIARIEHFTWANFAYTIAGGGTSSMLGHVPYRFKGLTAIGDIIFLYNFSIFMIFHICLIIRFMRRPRLLTRSLKHRFEGQFFPTYLLTWATILMDIEIYARNHTGVWRADMLRGLFWAYVGVCAVQASLQYGYIYISHKLTFAEISPSLLLIIFPLMLSGCIAANLIPSQPDNHAMPMLIGGATLQLMGFNVSMLIYAILIMKFFTKGLPPPDARPAVLIMVGPMAFTGMCLLLLGQHAQNIFPTNYVTAKVNAGAVFAVIGLYQALICWGTCLWMCLVGLVTVIHGALWYGMRFKLAWCAMVFPSAGMTILTIKLGEVIDCGALKWLGTIFAIIITAAYVVCTFFYIEAIWSKRIIYPGKDEDASPDPIDEEQIPVKKVLISSATSTSTFSTHSKDNTEPR